MSNHYIYLIKPLRAITDNEPVYKIGKTTRSNFKRFTEYPPGSKFIQQTECMDCHTMERKLLNIFNREFKLRRDYGVEYFEGNYRKMLIIINRELNNEMKSISDEPDEQSVSPGQADEEPTDVPNDVPNEEQRSNSKIFQCDICHYSTLLSSSFDKHLLSAKHILLKQEPDAKVFCCDTCDYVTITKTCYDRHLTSTKHKMQTRVLINNEGMFVCDICNKGYNSRPGLWSHKKKCLSEKNKEETIAKGKPIEEEQIQLEKKIDLSSSPAIVSKETGHQDNEAVGNNIIVPNDMFLKLFNNHHNLMNFIFEQQRESNDLTNQLRMIVQQQLDITTNIQDNNINN
jgi:Zinc-finger of C2H2 type